jgi:hypothetical protein
MRRTLLWLVGLGLLASMFGTKRSPADRVRYVADTPKAECDPSYPTLCIPVGAPDLDCDERSPL